MSAATRGTRQPRRHSGSHWPVRGGEQRHAAARRDRRSPSADAGEAALRAAGTADPRVGENRNRPIGLYIFTAARSGQTFSPASPSGAADAPVPETQAKGGANVEVTFTKRVDGFPALAGVTGGDAPGTFTGAVLSRDAFDNGMIVQLEAQYRVTADDPAHSFVVDIKGTQNNRTQQAVFNGTVTSGWLAGAQVHVTYDIPSGRYFLRADGAGKYPLLPGHDSPDVLLGELSRGDGGGVPNVPGAPGVLLPSRSARYRAEARRTASHNG